MQNDEFEVVYTKHHRAFKGIAIKLANAVQRQDLIADLLQEAALALLLLKRKPAKNPSAYYRNGSSVRCEPSSASPV